MARRFYDHAKQERDRIVATMRNSILEGLSKDAHRRLHSYAASNDTHLRKWAYTILGRIYKEQGELQQRIVAVVERMLAGRNEKVRQTAVYAAGEIGDFDLVADILELGMRDPHHSVRNGVVGALKTLGTRNPAPTIAFARRHTKDEDAEIRPQIVHGMELRGRTHPQEILPPKPKSTSRKHWASRRRRRIGGGHRVPHLRKASAAEKERKRSALRRYSATALFGMPCVNLSL